MIEMYEEVLVRFKKEKKKVELVEPATRLMTGLWVLSGEQSDSPLETRGSPKLPGFTLVPEHEMLPRG